MALLIGDIRVGQQSVQLFNHGGYALGGFDNSSCGSVGCRRWGARFSWRMGWGAAWWKRSEESGRAGSGSCLGGHGCGHSRRIYPQSTSAGHQESHNQNQKQAFHAILQTRIGFQWEDSKKMARIV